MSVEREKILKEVSQVAALAGIDGLVDDETGQFRFGWQGPNDRSQEVRVFPSGEVAGGVVVSFESVCRVLRKKELGAFVRKSAYQLLCLNGDSLFARFAVRETGRTDPAAVVIVSVDHLLATLDPEEFRETAVHVARAADRMEEIHGQDLF